MVRPISRRSLVISAGATTLIAVLGLALWPSIQPKLAVQSHRGTMAHDSERVATTPSETAQSPNSATVQLVNPKLTPSAHLVVTASGFLGKEQLVVTVRDQLGNSYEGSQVTLVAANDGRLHKTSLALPPQLATGDYQLLITGATSHRTATATFRMYTVPPSVVLDAYSAKPKQDVRFVGASFIPGEMVKVYLGKSAQPLASVRASERGEVAGHVGIPSLPAGNYAMTLVGEQSQTPATVGFSILGIAPWVVLDRYALMPGQSLGFNGQGFAAGETVLVYLNSTRGNPVMSVTADSAGQIIVQDSLTPSGTTGQNVLTFVGQSSKATTTAEFTILAAAQPAAQPTPPAAAP